MKKSIVNLGKQTLIYGLGDFLYKSIAFLLLPVYLKYLNPTEYGIIEGLMTFRGLLVTFIAMGFPNALFRFYYNAKNGTEKKEVISTILFINLLLQIVLPLIIIFNKQFCSTLILDNPKYDLYICLTAVSIFLLSFKTIPLYLIRAQQKALKFTIINFTMSIVTILMIIVFVVFLKKGVSGVLLGNICGGIVAILMLLTTLFKEFKIVFRSKYLRKILLFSLPLGFSLLPLTVIFMADRYFIIHFDSLNSLGVYALGYKFGNLFKIFIIMPFSLAWAPFVFSKENDNDAREVFRNVTRYFVMISLTCVVCISIFHIDVLKILTKNKDYYAAKDIVPIICYAFFFYAFSNILRIGCLITGKTHYVTAIMFSGLAFNLISNYFLIKLFGWRGASYALFFTFFVILTLSYYFSQKLYQIDYDFIKILTILFVSIIFVIISQLTNDIFHRHGYLIRLLLFSFFINYLYVFNLSKHSKQKLKKFLHSNFLKLYRQYIFIKR